MSISNLLVPNNYNLFAASITADSQNIDGNLSVTGDLIVDGSTSINNLSTDPGSLISLTNGTITFANSNVILNTATSVDLNLNQLSDVTTSSEVANQVLQWNGSAWINNNVLVSGNYNATFTAFTNVVSVTGENTTYMRIGNIVTVYFDCSYSASAVNSPATIFISLPVARTAGNFTTNEQLIGCAVQNVSTFFRTCQVYGHIGAQEGQIQCDGPGSNSNAIIRGSFQYSLV